jgi:ubiquinone biosynthesis protein
LGQLILESVGRGAAHRMAFPVELVLMVKAIVTFEGVGNILLPGFDVAQISKRHVTRILVERFTPLRMAQESLRGAPELLETLIKVPSLITEGLRLLEQATHRPAENPFMGIRGTLFGGFCLVAGAIFAALGGPWPVWAALVAIGILLPLRRGR